MISYHNMESENAGGDLPALQVDDFYFVALSASDEDLFPISDDNYAHALQLQEVLASSALAAAPAPAPLRPVPLLDAAIKHVGESSSSGPSFCKICMEAPSAGEMLSAAACSHSFCSGCLSRYVAGKVQENIHAVECPEVSCRATLQPEACRALMPREVFDRWLAALSEAMILGLEGLNCPFKDCSALLVSDGDHQAQSLREVECQNCSRLFCAQCKVAWHAGLSCEEFGRLREDETSREDVMLLQTAKKEKWPRCPKCRFFVEKTDGCNHITCRCGSEFCYSCGLKWEPTHVCRSELITAIDGCL